MKKLFVRFLACLLMAAMLIPCAAMAEINVNFEVPSFSEIFTPAAEYKLPGLEVPTFAWTHESGAFGCQIPTEWTETAPADGSNIPFFMAEDQIGSMTITLTSNDGTDMIAAFDEFKKVFTEMYVENGATIESFEIGSYGGRDAIVFQYVMLGIQQTQVMIQPKDYSAIVIFTFTASAQKHVRQVMDSVWLDD